MTRIVGFRTIRVETVDRKSRTITVETLSTALHATKGWQHTHRKITHEQLSAWQTIHHRGRQVSVKWSGRP